MYSSPYCSACGALLTRADTACPECGTPRVGPPAPPQSAAPAGEPTGSGFPRIEPVAPSELDYETRRGIDRTKTGVALLAIGSALGWIPVISLLGGFLVLVGAVLVILGREAFGASHSRNVVLALVLYLIGLFGVFILAASFAGSLEAAVALPASEVAGAVSQAFDSFLIGGIIVGLFSGFAVVLFLYSLLDTPGKILIWGSFFAAFGILILVWAVISGEVTNAIEASLATTPPDAGPLLALDAQLNGLKLLNVIPDLLLAGAAYVAWSRIDQGKIPAGLVLAAF